MRQISTYLLFALVTFISACTGGMSSNGTGATSKKESGSAPSPNAPIPVSGGKIEGSELHIVTVNGDELRVDANGFYFRTAKGNVLTVQGEEFKWVTAWGRFSHSGNEMDIVSYIDDPAKLRLASPGTASSAISFNQYNVASDRQEELGLILGSVSEDDPASLGGQLKIQVKRKNASNDEAMRLMGVISAAYTDNPEPTVRWLRLENGLGPFNQREFEP